MLGGLNIFWVDFPSLVIKSMAGTFESFGARCWLHSVWRSHVSQSVWFGHSIHFTLGLSGVPDKYLLIRAIPFKHTGCAQKEMQKGAEHIGFSWTAMAWIVGPAYLLGVAVSV